MTGFLLENKTAVAVTERIRSLKESFFKNKVSFGDIFLLILTDNGGEFANVSAIKIAHNAYEFLKSAATAISS